SPTRSLARRFVGALRSRGSLVTLVRDEVTMARYVGAVDQGTTSTRFMVFDKGGNEISRHQLEHEQILPQPGWVEHDPLEIAARTDEVIARAMRNANITAEDLAAIGVTNQRETTIVWNPKTG